MERAFTEEKRKNKIKELTSFFLHRHYCDNHAEAFVEYMDEVFLWFGAAEHEYIVGTENVAATLHTFKGKVPPCEISNEHYDVISVSENVYVCTGMLWISTSPSSDMYLRVHQRVTTVFRWTEQGPRCCHIHLSNPYTEMMEDDIGFPEKMSLESRKYFQEQIEAQKKKIEEQNASIIQMHFEDLSTGLYNRNKFNQVCDALREDCGERLGVAYFELLFFRERVGADFRATAALYAALIFAAVLLTAWVIHTLIRRESMKLELKILLNMGILFIGLLVNATVADYNTSDAQSTVAWGALGALCGTAALLFALGLWLARTGKQTPFINFIKRTFNGSDH